MHPPTGRPRTRADAPGASATPKRNFTVVHNATPVSGDLPARVSPVPARAVGPCFHRTSPCRQHTETPDARRKRGRSLTKTTGAEGQFVDHKTLTASGATLLGNSFYIWGSARQRAEVTKSTRLRDNARPRVISWTARRYARSTRQPPASRRGGEQSRAGQCKAG